MVSLVLVVSAASLLAADLPLPMELSALVLVGAILKVFLRRDDSRYARLEADLAIVREEASQQRHRAHLYDNRITGFQAALAMILPAARACTCDTMTPLIPVLEQLSTPATERGTP